MHRLLERQMRRSGCERETCSEPVRALIDLVERSYRDFDADRDMLERTVELSSEELFQANSEMRAVLGAVPDLFLWLDGDGEILNVQAGRGDDLLLPASGLIGRRIQDVPEAAASSRLSEALSAVHDRRAPVSIEYPLTIGGAAESYEARLLPLLRDQILAIIRNITVRKCTEDALANEKERLAVTLRSIADGVIATDTSGRVTMINRAAERITGWDHLRAVGAPVAEVLPIAASAGGDETHPVAAVLAGERAWVVEGESILAGTGCGGSRIAHSVSPIRSSNSESLGTVVCFRDVTVQHQAEEDRLRASKLDSIGILAGGIAHDFNNLLMAMLGASSLARHQATGHAELLDYLNEIESAVNRARDLTHQLLTFAKGGAPVKSLASITELIRECAVFSLRGSPSRCEIDIAENLYAADIDKGQMSQVLSNLIINAHQAMPGGGVVSLRAYNTDVGSEGGPDVRVEVRDRGSGIPAAVLPKIFDPYFTTKPQGSGLGLATSYSIVRNHGGQLLVDTSPEGTCFTIRLPVSPAAHSQTSALPSGVVHGRGRILVMDDQPAIRRLARLMLGYLGYRVCTVPSGEEALERFVEARAAADAYDVVIMDLTVPGAMGGLELVERLRAIDRDVRAIASSGYANGPVISRYREFGFTAVLTKPYTLEQIGETLHRVNPSARGTE
jgi:PAS domain S-box-containing protein